MLPAHPTQVNTPRLTPAMQAGTRFTYPGGMEGWVDLVDLIAPPVVCNVWHYCCNVTYCWVGKLVLVHDVLCLVIVIIVLFKDIWMKHGDGGESIYGPVFEGLSVCLSVCLSVTSTPQSSVVVFCVQLDECSWPQDECKWTNGHVVCYSLNKSKHRNEVDVY